MSQENYNVFVPSTSPELKNIADCAVSNLIPEKSKRQYDKCENGVGECCFGLFNGKIKNCEKFNFMEHIFNVEAHAEHTGWHWCYEVSEIGTFFEKKSGGYQAKKSKVLTRDQINLLNNLPFLGNFNHGNIRSHAKRRTNQNVYR
jgi:hypothetical protein